MSRNHEVTENHLLLNNQGELSEPGWSRSLIQKYDRAMIKAPKWRIKEWDYYLVLSQEFAGAFTISSDGRFEMAFIPVLDRAACLDFKVIVSDQHQVFGKMTGTAILDDGTKIQVRDMMCFAEKVHNKY